jgi:uncharacterized protein YdeI (YjbR/CyaY-like superfamily)
VKRASEEIRYFPDPAAWRAWLAEHHADRAELWVGFHKRASGKPSITWPESVDQALCFGWIDGLRKSIDEGRYKIRFTPRRASSIWSGVNIRRMAELAAQGLVHPAGQAAFDRRKTRTGVYSYEQRHETKLSPALAKELAANKKASAFLRSRPPGYQRLATFYVMSAKQEETRRRRLARLIADSARGQMIGLLARPGEKRAAPRPRTRAR